MGRRKSKRKVHSKIRVITPLETQFNCPFCNHEKVCEVKMCVFTFLISCFSIACSLFYNHLKIKIDVIVVFNPKVEIPVEVNLDFHKNERDSYEYSCEVYLFYFRDREQNVGFIACRVCFEDFQTVINYLSEPIDVYSDWIDACEQANP
ncbi:unnamed protein product [Thelazia callipaeda]|uniref:Transcription elongation factor 1 homolog n=1 Tax=Thelazia callipaeda TaxID=103827 RepID=A0A0N5CSI3_THECL|nr:unnamed protein product [Thelazia callipaeda]